jgi:pimeloyl-ACP methyl ester carboxylesterase
MTSTKRSTNVSRLPARPLRATLGLRHPAGSSPNSYLVEGCRVAWYEFPPIPAAPGQTVVCLHRIGSGSREFRPLIDRSPAGARLILLDWPGHGHSVAEGSVDALDAAFSVEHGARLLAAVLDQLGIRRPILLGSGFGAAVALHHAANHPDEVAALVLCQPAGLIAPHRQPYTPGHASNAARRQALREEILKLAFVQAISQAEASLSATQSHLRSALQSLACPILFALSRENKQYPLQRYLDLLDPALAQSPQHRFTVFSGSFHPIWDEPDRFAQTFTAFLQTQLPLAEHRHAWLLTAVDWPTRTMNLWTCVHPECDYEQALPEGQNPNDLTQPVAAS